MIWPFKSKNSSHHQSRPTKKRYYQAAKLDNLTAGWGRQILSADTVLNSDLETLRARSRRLAANDPYYKYWLKLQNRNVVGPRGIRLQMKVISRFNKDGSAIMDDKANRIIEQSWLEWGKRQNCTITKRYDFVMLQRLVLKSVLRDGEIFIRKLKGLQDNKFRFALQLIEADHLDMCYTSRLTNGHIVRMGVEYNMDGCVIAYHFIQRHPGDYMGPSLQTGQDRIRIVAEDIIHIHDPERVDQSRGIPEGVAAMIRANMLNGYQESELVAARTAASKMGFFITPDGESFEGDDSEFDADGHEQTVITEADPGTFNELPQGYDFKPYDPQHPTSAFGSFVKSILQGISSGLATNYPTLANDFEGVSYSSLRQANLNDRDGWKEMQYWLIEQLHEQIFPDWLLMSLTSGAIPLPTDKFDNFNQPSWRPRGWDWVDPQKEANANAINVEMGVKSLTQIAAEQGLDIEEIFQEKQSESTLAEKYGIILANNPQPVLEEKHAKED